MSFFGIAIFEQVQGKTVIVDAANMVVPARKAVVLMFPVVVFLFTQVLVLLVDGGDTALFETNQKGPVVFPAQLEYTFTGIVRETVM